MRFEQISPRERTGAADGFHQSRPQRFQIGIRCMATDGQPAHAQSAREIDRRHGLDAAVRSRRDDWAAFRRNGFGARGTAAGLACGAR